MFGVAFDLKHPSGQCNRQPGIADSSDIQRPPIDPNAPTTTRVHQSLSAPAEHSNK